MIVAGVGFGQMQFSVPATDAPELAKRGIRIPSLFIAGDRDDAADFSGGIKPAFEGSVNSDRCMLVYENARPDTGGIPAPTGLTSLRTMQFFDEPVWRKDRIAGINQHFITAFFDLYLKGVAADAAYLHPGAVRSNDSWKGFQKRWAVGLEMYCRTAGN